MRPASVALAGFVLAATASASGARDTRTLSGRVFDATGAALPGVTVTLDEGAAARAARTAPDGRDDDHLPARVATLTQP